MRILNHRPPPKKPHKEAGRYVREDRNPLIKRMIIDIDAKGTVKNLAWAPNRNADDPRMMITVQNPAKVAAARNRAISSDDPSTSSSSLPSLLDKQQPPSRSSRSSRASHPNKDVRQHRYRYHHGPGYSELVQEIHIDLDQPPPRYVLIPPPPSTIAPPPVAAMAAGINDQRRSSSAPPATPSTSPIHIPTLTSTSPTTLQPFCPLPSKPKLHPPKTSPSRSPTTTTPTGADQNSLPEVRSVDTSTRDLSEWDTGQVLSERAWMEDKVKQNDSSEKDSKRSKERHLSYDVAETWKEILQDFRRRPSRDGIEKDDTEQQDLLQKKLLSENDDRRKERREKEKSRRKEHRKSPSCFSKNAPEPAALRKPDDPRPRADEELRRIQFISSSSEAVLSSPSSTPADSKNLTKTTYQSVQERITKSQIVQEKEKQEAANMQQSPVSLSDWKNQRPKDRRSLKSDKKKLPSNRRRHRKHNRRSNHHRDQHGEKHTRSKHPSDRHRVHDVKKQHSKRHRGQNGDKRPKDDRKGEDRNHGDDGKKQHIHGKEDKWKSRSERHRDEMHRDERQNEKRHRDEMQKDKRHRDRRSSKHKDDKGRHRHGRDDHKEGNDVPKYPPHEKSNKDSKRGK